jgi:hypothetical protein
MATKQIDRGYQHNVAVWSVLMTTLGSMFDRSTILREEVFAKLSCFIAIAVILRVISRLMWTRKLGWDDWMMIVGLVCSLF